MSSQELKKLRERLLERTLCNPCIGRQFAEFGEGLKNETRANIVCQPGSLNTDRFENPTVSEFQNSGISNSCELCEGMFARIPDYLENIRQRVEPFEYESFLIGIRMPERLEKKEKEFQKSLEIEYGETMKSELKRRLGKQLDEITDAHPDFDKPDLRIVLNPEREEVRLTVKSLYVYGQYNKYSRNISQTYFPCPECGGGGCNCCDDSGSLYDGSVAGRIKGPFLEKTGARRAVFHGGGREDVDVRCLGKREFVLELKEPQIRTIDPADLQEAINSQSDDVEVFSLVCAERETVREVKEKRADKTYRARVELGREVSQEKLKTVSEFSGVVHQRTPSRVKESRGDRIREREVYKIELEEAEDREMELIIETEAGTYIKELISGDGGRTEPSVSQLLDTPAVCKELDVVWIDSTLAPQDTRNNRGPCK